jgi:hypothetical protein
MFIAVRRARSLAGTPVWRQPRSGSSHLLCRFSAACCRFGLHWIKPPYATTFRDFQGLSGTFLRQLHPNSHWPLQFAR